MAERGRFGAKLLQGFLVGLAGILVALALWSLSWLDTWEAKTWDWRVGLLAEPGPATGDVTLILLDQNSLDWALKENGLTWPWPREIFGAIVNYCKRSGARAVSFDVLFTEPSKYGLDDDRALGAAVADFGRFAGAVFLGRSSGNQMQWNAGDRKPAFKIKGLDRWLAFSRSDVIVFPRASLPIPELADSAALLCNVNLKSDPDGIYRKVKLFSVFDGVPLISLGIGTYLAANPNTTGAVRPGRLTVGDRSIPIDRDGRAVLRYRGPSGTHKAYSAAAVLQSEIRILNGERPTIQDTTAFKDKFVLFGYAAPGLYDLRSAPVGGVYTGVEIHATMLDNFLSGDFMRTTPLWLTLLLVVMLSMAGGIAASIFSSPLGNVATSTVLILLPIGLSLGAYSYGFWLPLVVLEASLILSVAFALVINYATEGRQKLFIKNAFKQYLSPAVIEQLLQNPERLKLGGERRVLSIFFSDLEGFTSISEGLDPETLTNLLNEYLSAMTDIIHEEGGTVDKYEGDAIIAFWNAPLAVSDHAVRVVQAALRCQDRLAELRPAFKQRIGKNMFMRIGINTGTAVVGNMGSRTRFDYTMLGDAVNLAARLEGINKQFGTHTIISQSTLDLMGDAFGARELARVAVVGRKEPVTVYEPMFAETYQNRKSVLNTFAKGFKCFYEGDFTGAQHFFNSISKLDPARSYLKKCADLIQRRPENWNGVWIMTTK